MWPLEVPPTLRLCIFDNAAAMCILKILCAQKIHNTHRGGRLGSIFDAYLFSLQPLGRLDSAELVSQKSRQIAAAKCCYCC